MKITFTERYLSSNKAVLMVVKKRSQEEGIVFSLKNKKLILGIKNPKKINKRKFFLLARKVIHLAKKNNIKKIAIKFSDWNFPQLKLESKEVAEILATNFIMANYQFNRYKQKPKEGWRQVEEIVIVGKINYLIKQSFKKGKIIAEQVNACRNLANTPGRDMTPKLLLQASRQVTRGTKIKVKAISEIEMKKLGMRGVLSVGQGSYEKSQFIILEYFGGKDKKDKPIILVGKGVTYDSGGINIKPAEAMKDMQLDMSGGAAVLQTIVLADKLKLKQNIIALIPAVENMPGGKSYRMGDIIKTFSGKTVEVGHTDAEGRIILADALTYAEKYNPKLVIDVATLTGAALVALGQRASAIYSSDEKYHNILKTIGEETGEYVWPMPLWEEFEDEVKGIFGDISNVGKYKVGGSNTAAAFLYQFAKKYPWIHIDIAPTMTSVEDQLLERGATGVPVRLLIKFLENI